MYIKSMQYNAYCAKGGFLSEKSAGFLLLPTLPKNIPFYYPKLLHPVHDIALSPLRIYNPITAMGFLAGQH